MKLATLCYVRDGNKTLMLHRIKKENDMHEGKWNGLGGKFESGETPEECVVREVEEESGLVLNEPKLKGLITFPNFNNKEDWRVFVFVADDFTGSLIDSSEGVLDWIENDKLLDLNLWDGDKIFIPWLDDSKFFSGKMIYVDGKLVESSVNFY